MSSLRTVPFPNLEATGEADPSELDTLPVKSSLAVLVDFQ